MIICPVHQNNFFLIADDDGKSEKDLEWLQLHLEPWVDVKARWKKTHELRFREKELKRLSGEEWFKLYSCLRGKSGFELVSMLKINGQVCAIAR